MKYFREDWYCIVCGTKGVALHHVKTQGAGGSDHEQNLMPLCIFHHNEVHSSNMGLARFARKYIAVYSWLLNNGWEYDSFSRKWLNGNSKKSD